ncbi:hypothetical protein NECAME_01647 [Necator americanus]|uniref:Uncharacterized protein n=1 Tax=Necator americanus TaxID=51031 RepID=W2TTJ2_NECAM|nr:hypothetical protein NECAME_01647 [Necator americanus]ETN84421.1 hypothetical protein NECAME_01647 [Necator americanus]
MASERMIRGILFAAEAIRLKLIKIIVGKEEIVAEGQTTGCVCGCWRRRCHRGGAYSAATFS